MKPPSILPRLTGSPFGALLLFGLYGAIWMGCYRGTLPAWLAAITVLFAVATANSVIEVQHYKRMMAAWEAGGQGSQEELDARRRKPSWLSMLVAVALLLFIPTLHVASDGTVMHIDIITWLLSACYLVVELFKLVRSRKPRVAKERKQKQADTQAAPVEYLMGKASSSPSFEEATNKLPDYAAKLIRDPQERF